MSFAGVCGGPGTGLCVPAGSPRLWKAPYRQPAQLSTAYRPCRPAAFSALGQTLCILRRGAVPGPVRGNWVPVVLGCEPRVWEWGMGTSTCLASLPPRLTLCSAVRRPREAHPLSGCAVSPLPSSPLPSGAFWGGTPSQPGPVPIDLQVPASSVCLGTRVGGALAGLPSQPLSSPAL